MHYSSPDKPSQPVWRISKGAEQYDRETGLFEVRYGKEAFGFSNLLQAFLFYLKLDEPATLWDITEEAVLVEEKVWLTPIQTNPPENNRDVKSEQASSRQNGDDR